MIAHQSYVPAVAGERTAGAANDWRRDRALREYTPQCIQGFLAPFERVAPAELTRGAVIDAECP
ncbi:MAG TPA: hypothetical protein VGM50_00380 [Gemmatimonadaceae bacterium]